MKRTNILLILMLLPLLGLVACDSDSVKPIPEPEVTDLMVNEFMASNNSLDVDGSGGFPDWLELYNTTAADIDIAGYYLTDKIGDDVVDWYQIPTGSSETIVPAGGWLVLFADKHPENGVLHLDFSLKSGGESIGLADANEAKIVSFEYEQQTSDVSMGLSPDGSTNDMVFLATATPGAANSAAMGNLSPVVTDLNLDPVSPLPDAPVTVNAEVFDDSGIMSVILYYNVDGGDWQEVAMSKINKVTEQYTAVIPAQALDAVVGYYVLVTDSDLETATLPTDAPTSVESYTPVFQLDFVLFINEFVASNETGLMAPGQYEVPADAYTDWIEIFNPSDSPIDIGGMYITDDMSSNQEWQIPTTYPDSTTIDAGGYLVLFADKETQRGVLHVDIKLGSGGEDVALFADDGSGHVLMVDGYTYTSATTDVSEGRETDGADTWTTFATPTPGSSNGGK